MGVELLNDATTDTLIIGLSPDSNGFHDYSDFSESLMTREAEKPVT